jgi:hypothetical protein
MFNRSGMLSLAMAGAWLAGTTGAWAQEYEPEPEAAPEPVYDEAPIQEEAEPAPPPAQWAPPPSTVPGERVDGVRFRGGVAFTVGPEFVPAADFSAMMFGVDGRLGVQINHLLGFYLASHLSFGSSGTVFSSTGTFAFIPMVDITLADTFFVGGGFGYAVFNNPSGPALAIRAGAYPVKSAREDQKRRRGLMLSLEMRTVFLGAPYDTGFMFMGAIGYEAF